MRILSWHRVRIAALAVLVLVVSLVVAALLLVQTSWFRDRLKNYIVGQAQTYLNADLSIGRLSGSLVSGIVFEDVAVGKGGTTIVGADRIALDYSLRDIVSSGLVVKRLTLVRPTAALVETRDGWNVTHLVKKQAEEQERTGPGRPLSIEQIEIVDGDVRVSPCGADCGREPASFNIPRRVRNLYAQLSFAYKPVDVFVDVQRLSLIAESPGLELRQFSGRIAVANDDIRIDRLSVRTPGTDLRVNGTINQYTQAPVADIETQASPVSFEEIARFVPAAAQVTLTPRVTARVQGGPSDLRARFNIDDPAGQASGTLRLQGSGTPRAVAADVRVEQLNVGAIVRDPALASRINGSARVDARLRDWTAFDTASGTFAVKAATSRVGAYQADALNVEGTLANGRATVNGKARAYGSEITTNGTIDVPSAGGSLAFDLSGRARGVNLARMPAALQIPRLNTNVGGQYHAVQAEKRIKGEFRFARSTIEGGTIGEGAIARFGVGGGAPDFGFTGDVSDVNLRRFGAGLRMRALDDPRLESSVAGHLDVQGQGTALNNLTMRAEARLRNSQLAEVRVPDLLVTANIANAALIAEVVGSFSNLDPARFGAGPNLAGRVQGTLSGQVAIADLAAPITPDALGFTGGVTLMDSKVGRLALDRGTFSGHAEAGVVTIESAEVTGPTLRLNAKGQAAIGTTGDSNLHYRVEVRQVKDLAAMFGQDVTGMGVIEGTMTGNRAEYATTGTLIGNAIRYGTVVNLLQVNTDYTVQVPNLSFADARGKVHAVSTMPVIAGRELNRVRADLTFDAAQVGFDLDVQERARTLATAGQLTVHPDHREIHVDRLALGTGTTRWELAPGRRAAVRYGGQRVEFEGVDLVSGAQRVSVTGAYGLGPGVPTTLDARLDGIDLASLGELLLVPEMKLSGTLNATAHVTGQGTNRSGTVQFAFSQGTIRGFSFVGADGKLTFDPSIARVDARVRQTATATLTATGTLPAPALGITGAPGSTGGPLDVRLAVEGVDLSILETVTDQVAKARGTLVADVRVTGSVAQPTAVGQVRLDDAAFLLTSTGGQYQGIRADVALRGDRIEINDLQALDKDGDPLRVRGQLAMNGYRPGALSLTVDGRKFKLIDNELGDVSADFTLAMKGEVTTPAITGDVRLTSGRLEIDRLLDQLGSRRSARPAGQTVASTSAPIGGSGRPGEPAVTAATPGASTAPSSAPAVAQEAAPPTADTHATATPGPSVDVKVVIPDNLIVRGSDIQPPNTPMSLGDMNITLGGDFTVRKPPTGEAMIVGAINTVRGTYTFQGRRFEILRDGRVLFHGNTPPDPGLDIRAQRDISGILAQVRVRGTATKPILTLTSDPPMDESEVLALIVFNAPINQLSEGQKASLGARAGALASGFIANPLSEALGKALDLDVFEIRGFGVDGSGPQVTLGEQVGDRLYVSLQQQLGSQEVSEFMLEYRLNQFLRLKGSLAEGQSRANRMLTRRVERSAIDLVLLIQY